MRKIITLLLVGVILIQLSGIAFAQAPSKPKRGGCVACLYAWFFGPRAGYMYNEGVGIRMMEWLTLVLQLPLILQWIDIWNGVTWTEIEIKEKLRDPEFAKWHVYKVQEAYGK